MSELLIEIKDLECNIDNQKILQGLNLKINKGEVHAIMGPNGSGKSTLSSVLAGDLGLRSLKVFPEKLDNFKLDKFNNFKRDKFNLR